MLKILIVDDERLARQEMRLLLADFDNLDIVGEAGSIADALKIIEEKQPDAIFLDIQLSGENGFDLFKKSRANFKVIFVTAYDEFALRAFEVNALDYLMKPVSSERLEQAVKRLFTPIESLTNSSNVISSRQLEIDDLVLINHHAHFIFLKVGTISHIVAANDYTEINIDNGKKLLSEKPLREWEEQLPERYFVRIHRSVIVNLERVARIEKWFNNSYQLYLKNYPEPLNVSRRYGSKLKKKFG